MTITIEKPNLTSYQENILYNPFRFTITEASTKVGKTFSHIYWIFERAHADWNKRNYNHWWVAPIYSQAKIAFNRLKAIIAPTNLYKINETNLTITTPQGVHIHFKSADKPNNLFGEDVYSAVFDEAPRAKFESWVALRTTLTATQAPCKIIGNFGGSANWVHQLKKKAAEPDTEYAYFKITAWDAVREGILDEKEILQAQKDLPEKVFKQLYLAEESETEDMLISYDSMEDLFTNDFIEEGAKAMTCDIAMLGSDRFVIAVWSGFVLEELLIFPKTDGKEVVDIIKETSQKHGVGRSRIVYDADGLGSYLSGYLKGAKPFHNGGKVIKLNSKTPNYKNLKSQCCYEFAKNIDKFRFKVLEHKSEILTELEMLRSYNLDADGKIQIMPKAKVKEYLGKSPDILDALIMRWYLEINSNKFITARA